MTTAYTRILLRRDTAANWTSANPILAAGELGIELPSGNFKIGDGTTAWASLAYSLGGSAVLGARLTPILVSEPIAAPATMDTLLFAAGNAGPQTINNIGVPPAIGAKLVIVCRSTVNGIELTAAGNIEVNGGDMVMQTGSIISLVWDGVKYSEVSRNGV